MDRALRRRLIAVVTLGAALLVVGIALVARNSLTGRSFGWAAYTPVADDVFARRAPGLILLMQPASWWGLALAAVGALAISGALGYALASRRRRSTAGD